jgi:hypothetical protein
MQVLPIIPLYPSFDFMTYNPSLGLPGPKLYDIPVVGKYAKDNGFPNTKSSILFPDVEYIKMFANYELGIGRAIENAAKNSTLSKIKDPKLKDDFSSSFDAANQNDSMGIIALERSIISSIFESQKPYFIIAQFAIENIVKIEDIIARICPLLGAAINPPMALAIKSRKPTNNGPSENNVLGLSKYGTPPALGFKSPDDVQSRLDGIKTITQKGLDIKINKGGKFDTPLRPKSKGPTFSSIGGEYNYDYVTVSAVYSTGQFDENVMYNYTYIDLPPDPELPPVVTGTSSEINKKPERIIFGIYDSSGTPINPRDKLQYYDLDANNNLIKVDSIFEKASWIYQTKKWIFNASVKNPNMYNWETLDQEDYLWKGKFGDIKTQHESPGAGYERLKYKDVIDFSIPENQSQKFKENDFVTSFTQSGTINDYKKYYDSLTENGLNKAQIDTDERPDIKREIEKLYDDNTLNQQLQNLFKFGKLKTSYYDGVDGVDYGDNPPSTTFPDKLRRIFKPMEFKIAGENIWIDPEVDYDFKIIRVESSRKVDFLKSEPLKNSEITNYIKNYLDIKVKENGSDINFSIQVFKNGNPLDNLNNVDIYSLSNWNFEFDNSSLIFNKKSENVYRIVTYLTRPPKRYNKTLTFKNINPNFDKPLSDNYSLLVDEEITYKIQKTGDIFKLFKVIYKYYQNISQDKSSVTTYQLQSPGVYTLPDGFQVEVGQSGVITKWFLLNDTITLITKVSDTSNINKDSQKIILPGFYKRNTLTFNLDNLKNYPQKLTPFYDITTEDIYKFRALLTQDGEQRVIDTDNSINNKLITNELYSKGRYGIGWKGGQTKDQNGNAVGSIEDNPMKVGYIKRGQLTELDNETYFIIEGVRRDSNKTETPTNTSENIGQNGNSSGGFYFLFDAIGIVPVVIELAIDLFTRFFPEINKLISLIKNPASFITEIITSKVTDPNSGFSVFSDKSKELLQDFQTKSQLVKSNPDSLETFRDEVKNSELGNYVFVKDNGDYKFLLDGPAVIDFFSLAFGIKVDFSNSFLPISPIFGADFSDKNSLKNFLNSPKSSKITDTLSNTSDKSNSITNKVTNQKINDNLDKLIPSDVKSKGQQESLNYVVNQSGTRLDYQDVSILYPKGIQTDTNYEFIYTDEKIGSLLTEADNLSIISDVNNLDSGDTIKNLQDAQSKYQQAIDLEKSKGIVRDSQNKITGFDATKVNQPLISSIQSKLNDLKSKINVISQPIFKMILGLATTPLKVVLSIIQKLIDLFKNMLNPFTMPQTVMEFLSFQWIMEYFTPIGLLKLAGVNFDPKKAIEWCVAVNVPNPLFGIIPGMTQYIIPDEFPIADLSQFLDVSFMAKLPTYNAKQYRELCLKPFRIFTTFLCFFEKIINAFIMLVWSIMGITAIIPPPLIKLCDKLNENLKPEDAMDVVDGLFKDGSNTSATASSNSMGMTYSGDGSSYNFIYEVQLEDGTVVRNLDAESLQRFIEENKETNYDFANFSTIE